MKATILPYFKEWENDPDIILERAVLGALHGETNPQKALNLLCYHPDDEKLLPLRRRLNRVMPRAVKKCREQQANEKDIQRLLKINVNVFLCDPEKLPLDKWMTS